MRQWNCQLKTGMAVVKSAARGLAALAIGGALFSTSLADDVVFSNKARFRIPYQLDDAEIRRLRAKEIQLHVSTNDGEKWRHVDSVPPVQGKFTFEAVSDGEYWFSVRTIGDDGNRHPSGPLEAGLKVHIDTVSPTLHLKVSEASPGQISLQWSAADDYLDVESLALEYRDSNAGEWQTINVVPTEAGETSWSVPSGGNIAVRGLVKDRAGNTAKLQKETEISGVVIPEMPAAPTVRRPIAETPPQPTLPANNEPLADITPTPAANPGELPSINPNNGGDYSQFVSKRTAMAEQDTSPPPAGHPQPVLPPPQSTPPSTLPPATVPTQTMPRPRQMSNIRRVNSTNFKIGYAIDDVGPSGVSSVDLYITEDQGRQWFHYGVDENNVSPFEVTVPADGTYGFAIRVRSGVGLTQSPPQPGQTPEVSIVVDRTPPQVNLMPIKQGHGQLPSQLLIEWTMTDEQLADRPVSLYYAPRLSGPWLPITGWEPNTGRYLWTLGPDAPRQVYIRLEARDSAGNMARVETPEPLLIDLSRPTARIIDVESMSPRY